MQGTVLITGGAKRIGHCIALAMAQRGYNVALHYRSSLSEAESTAMAINEMGVLCETFQSDLSDSDQVKALLSTVYNRFPDLNLLINNASVFIRGGFMDTDDYLYEQHMKINLKAPFFLIQHFVRTCKKGHVINILDTRISKITTQYFAYAISKRSLLLLTEMAAKTLGPDIRVNGIAPGLILPSSYQSENQFKKMSEKIPLKRTGKPDDVSSAIFFFLENEYITGEVLYIDGGEHLM